MFFDNEMNAFLKKFKEQLTIEDVLKYKKKISRLKQR